MTCVRALLIYWDGDMIETPFGANVINGNTRLVNFTKDFDFGGLQSHIRTALNLNESVMIIKILFHHPVMEYGRNMIFGFMHILNSSHVRHMFDMVSHYPGWLIIELYVAFIDCGSSDGPCDEAGPSNYMPTVVDVEAVVDAMEEDNDADNDSAEYDGGCTDDDDDVEEEHFWDDSSTDNDDWHADVVGGNEHEEDIVRLVKGLNRDISPYVSTMSSQFKSISFEDMQVNQNLSTTDDMFWDPSKDLKT